MGLDNIIRMIRAHGVVIIGVGILLVPAFWAISSMFYKERIDTLRERISLLEEKLTYAESKLKSPAEFVKNNESPSSSAPSVASNTPLEQVAGVAYRYPPVQNSNKLTKSEVRDLAKFYGLLTEWKMNPHLRFLEGDISYWYEQNLSEKALKKQFEARRIVLVRAEKSGLKYSTHGELSHAAEQILSTLGR